MPSNLEPSGEHFNTLSASTPTIPKQVSDPVTDQRLVRTLSLRFSLQPLPQCPWVLRQRCQSSKMQILPMCSQSSTLVKSVASSPPVNQGSGPPSAMASSQSPPNVRQISAKSVILPNHLHLLPLLQTALEDIVKWKTSLTLTDQMAQTGVSWEHLIVCHGGLWF